MPYQIYSAIERSSTQVPINQIMRNGNLDLREDVVGSGYFAFSLKKDRLVLEAGNYIGLIPLNDRVAILVEPKIARSKWLQIVERSETSLRELNHLRAYSQTEYLSSSVLEFLIRALIHQLNAVDQYGLYAKYKPVKERTSFPRGRILLKDSIRDAWSKGFAKSVAVEYYLFSRDIPHNRLLKYAIYLSTRYIESFSPPPLELQQRLDELSNLFGNIPFDQTLRYLPEVSESLERNTLPDVRAYYADALKTALLIVENTGITPNIAGTTSTLSFVVNMESTFERYCQTVLINNSSRIGSNIQVKGQKEGKKPLFKGVSSDARDAEPDIVISSGDKDLLVVEVKYKDKPNRQDLNQAVTYALAYKIRQVVLLCFTEQNESSWQFLGEVGDLVEVWVYRLGLEQEDIDIVENKFIEAIKDMISGSITPPL